MENSKFVVAVLVPCYNEEEAIGKVVSDFKTALPDALLFVYDNGSTDKTIEVATKAGAIVRSERHKGKGNVVRRMFADVEADVYVLVDGDDTYDASAVSLLIETLIGQQLDMVNGARVSSVKEAYRAGHRWGNAALTGLVRFVFGAEFKDMLSGYRVFSRRYVKSFPAFSRGFEIETELTVHALELGIPVEEVETKYKERPPGSVSKLATYRDGFRILKTIGSLIKEERPLEFFGLSAVAFLAAGLGLGLPVVTEFMDTGLVPRLPTAVLATGLTIVSIVSLGVGMILDTVTKGRRETKKLHYLSIPVFSSRRR